MLRGTVGARYEFWTFVGEPPYIRRLINEYTAIYTHRLTDEYTDLRSSVSGIFLYFSIKEYSSVKFLGTEEFIKTEEDILFSCSELYPIHSIYELTSYTQKGKRTERRNLTCAQHHHYI
jgi:hypothetical protein